MLKNKLLECGVEPGRIEVIPDEQEATSKALQTAGPGDLLLVLADNTKRTWKQIIYFNSGARAEAGSSKVVPGNELPETDGFEFDDNIEIISDERGVRIAREAGD
jgi:cyanophycin synthetase